MEPQMKFSKESLIFLLNHVNNMTISVGHPDFEASYLEVSKAKEELTAALVLISGE